MSSTFHDSKVPTIPRARRLGTWNLEPGTWNLELGTWNPKGLNSRALKANLMSVMNNTTTVSFVLFTFFMALVGTLLAQQVPQQNKPLTDRELELLAVIEGRLAAWPRPSVICPMVAL